MRPKFIHSTLSLLQLIQENKSSIIHCPMTNSIYGEGVSPIGYFIHQGVSVGLGTDCSGTYNGNDILSTLHMAAYLHRLVTSQPSLTGEIKSSSPMFNTPLLSPNSFVKMITSEGAKAINLKDCGVVKPGYLADLVLMQPPKIDLHVCGDPLTYLTYFADTSSIKTVIIDGKVILDNKSICELDEKRMEENLIESCDRLFKDLQE